MTRMQVTWLYRVWVVWTILATGGCAATMYVLFLSGDRHKEILLEVPGSLEEVRLPRAEREVDQILEWYVPNPLDVSLARAACIIM